MPTRTRSQHTAALAPLAGGVLLLAAPTPAGAAMTLRSLTTTRGGAPQDAVAGVLAVVALGAWLLVAYLAVVVLLTFATRLPGVGAFCAGLLRRLAPAALRSAVAVALGAAVVIGTTSGASAAPVSSSTTELSAGTSTRSVSVDPGSIGDLDWPSPTPRAAVPAPTGARPTLTPAADTPSPTSAPSFSEPPAAPAPTHPPAKAPVTSDAPSRTPDASEVVVHSGDTLWGLAAQTLPTGAPDAAVAAAWPAWWEANREVIGDDPDQLWPGQVLQAPA